MSEYILPMAGTPAHSDFLIRARDPNSLEGKVAAQMANQASEAMSQRFRAMLQQMIDLVPGQVFRDVKAFHEKFGLEPTDDPGHRLPDDVLKFRIQFMQEELDEYISAVGGKRTFCQEHQQSELEFDGRFDAEEALDAILDLCYVAVGTAVLHRFSEFNEAWRRVQEANMSKVRAESSDDDRSHRKHRLDVVKPAGFKPPVFVDLLDEPCYVCEGRGRDLDRLDGSPGPTCAQCSGTRRQRRRAKESTDGS